MSKHVNEIKVTTADEAIFTRDQLAQKFSVCKHTIRLWEKKNLLPVIRINRRVLRYRASDVQKLMEVA